MKKKLLEFICTSETLRKRTIIYACKKGWDKKQIIKQWLLEGNLKDLILKNEEERSLSFFFPLGGTNLS